MSSRERLALLGGNLESRTARAQYLLGLRCAHALVVQTEAQAHMAERSSRPVPQVIPNFCPAGERRTGTGEYFLWVGAFVGVKDPLSYLALAERVPEAHFLMVARQRAGWDQLAHAVQARAARIPNVELIDGMPRDALLDLYRRAIAVVSTSEYEGFSNVFLEGWSRGIPALSLRVDPDGVISRRGLGRVAAGSLASLAEAARHYFTEPVAASQAGDASFRYVEERHAPDVVGRKWAALVEGQLA